MPRDPKPLAVAKIRKEKAVVEQCERQLRAGQRAYRRAILAAIEVGISRSQLGRDLGTSESRIRQLEQRARGEQEMGPRAAASDS
jgi:hypothetical protein